jgi:hypothetical protein
MGRMMRMLGVYGGLLRCAGTRFEKKYPCIRGYNDVLREIKMGAMG